MLKRIIEYRNGCSALRCNRNSVWAISIDDDRNFRVEILMHEYFIFAVPSEDNCGSLASTQQLGSDPRGERRFPRSSDGEIPNTYHRNHRALDSKKLVVVHPASCRGQCAIARFYWQECDARRTRQRILTVPDALYQ